MHCIYQNLNKYCIVLNSFVKFKVNYINKSIDVGTLSSVYAFSLFTFLMVINFYPQIASSVLIELLSMRVLALDVNSHFGIWVAHSTKLA